VEDFGHIKNETATREAGYKTHIYNILFCFFGKKHFSLVIEKDPFSAISSLSNPILTTKPCHQIKGSLDRPPREVRQDTKGRQETVSHPRIQLLPLPKSKNVLKDVWL
jgi:hypothetical protein